jgi:hypothetical protein
MTGQAGKPPAHNAPASCHLHMRQRPFHVIQQKRMSAPPGPGADGADRAGRPQAMHTVMDIGIKHEL